MTDTAIIAIAGILTTIAGFAFQAYREAATRRWTVEDRKRIEEKVVTEAERITIQAATQAALAASQAAANSAKLTVAIAENTEISAQTLTQVNGVGKKMDAAKEDVPHDRREGD